MDWDRLMTQMIREMIRQFLTRPGEFLTFSQLVFRIPGADKDVLHALAEQRLDLFVVARNDNSIKLHTEVVGRVVRKGIEAAMVESTSMRIGTRPANGHVRCAHFSEEELLADLQRCSLPSEALTRGCCWSEVCRLRGLNSHLVDEQSWRDICATRGYLLARQNPRGF